MVEDRWAGLKGITFEGEDVKNEILKNESYLYQEDDFNDMPLSIVLKVAADLIAHHEHCYECEFGIGRSIEEMIEDHALPPIYHELLKRIELIKRVEELKKSED